MAVAEALFDSDACGVGYHRVYRLVAALVMIGLLMNDMAALVRTVVGRLRAGRKELFVDERSGRRWGLEIDPNARAPVMQLPIHRQLMTEPPRGNDDVRALS